MRRTSVSTSSSPVIPVRQTQRAGGDATAGQVDRLEAGALGQQRMIGVDRTDHLQGMFAGDRVAKR